MSRGCKLATHDLWRLDRACRLIYQAFDEPAYLVGTAGFEGAEGYRDVDVRLILDDEEFDALFAEPAGVARWELLSLAIGDHLRVATGLPIDFQIQRWTEANEKHPKPRNPLGLRDRRTFAGGGDATPEGFAR